MKRVYIKMTLLDSILADIFSISILLGGVWFNQKFCNGSYFVNAIILIFLFFEFLGYQQKYLKECNFKQDKENEDG